jgi:hypothetical protein
MCCEHFVYGITEYKDKSASSSVKPLDGYMRNVSDQFGKQRCNENLIVYKFHIVLSCLNSQFSIWLECSI